LFILIFPCHDNIPLTTAFIYFLMNFSHSFPTGAQHFEMCTSAKKHFLSLDSQDYSSKKYKQCVTATHKEFRNPHTKLL